MQENDRIVDPDRVIENPDRVIENAASELERASHSDHETRLEVLEGLYRSLEAELDAAGSEALR